MLIQLFWTVQFRLVNMKKFLRIRESKGTDVWRHKLELLPWQWMTDFVDLQCVCLSFYTKRSIISQKQTEVLRQCLDIDIKSTKLVIYWHWSSSMLYLLELKFNNPCCSSFNSFNLISYNDLGQHYKIIDTLFAPLYLQWNKGQGMKFQQSNKRASKATVFPTTTHDHRQRSV